VTYHTPVMLAETMEVLRVAPGGRYCDATVGGGGHAQSILERSAPDGRLVAIDRDPEAIAQSRERLARYGERATFCQGNYADVATILARLELPPVDGLLVDLGVSSHQLDDARRGFSFAADGPLDMRMGPDAPMTAADLVTRLSEEDLTQVIRELGEEPAARKIARAIKRALARGELRSTADLSRVVDVVVGGRSPRRRRIHPATRTFQALRMAVNEELPSLQRFLESFVDVLRPGGRVAVIAFHSLEDRAVKQGLARLARPCTCPPRLPVCACGRRPTVLEVTHRPLRPSPEELTTNARARSARLRAAERV
jgi:16S rRNA (cytosine1402-N4)-methyltransferase